MAPRPTSRAFRRRLFCAGLYAATGILFAGWLLSACSTPATPATDVLLVVSGDTQGWITPCGCTSNQSGGLPRRATYLAGLRKSHTVLYADAGGAADGTAPYDLAKFHAILQGELAMDIAAHNLGAAEIALGAENLRRIAAETKIPFLSANALSPDGNLITDPIRIIPIGGIRVGLIGVVSPKFQTPEIQITPPRQAILRLLDEKKTQCDRIVILAYLPEDELTALARDLPEADAVVGGPTGQSLRPSRLGPTLLASATRKGKFVLEASLTATGATIIELNDRYTDAPAQMQNLAAFRKTLAAKDFPASQTHFAKGADRLPAVAGSTACRDCHTPEFTQWSSSGHGHAWKSLVAQEAHVDPSCQVCHTTNYGAPQGFLSIAASKDRVDVGCESCHGPSASHVTNPKTRTPFLAAAQCITCHDEENSPKFAYDAFWAKIRHGKTPATREAAK